MPRQSSVAILDTTGTVMTPLSAIPKDLIKYLEDVYKRQQTKPGRERAIYDSEDELKAEFKLMADYLAQRPEGILAIRKSPTRKENLPDDLKAIRDRIMDFRITADLPANGTRNGGNPTPPPAAK